nr:hypothetical protein [Butyricicoccus porcorum]
MGERQRENYDAFLMRVVDSLGKHGIWTLSPECAKWHSAWHVSLNGQTKIKKQRRKPDASNIWLFKGIMADRLRGFCAADRAGIL